MSSLAMSSSLGMLYQHTSQHYHQAKDGSPRSDEHKELIKQRKLREAEEYKNMHVLMNPLLSQRSNEEMLKGMLGMACKLFFCLIFLDCHNSSKLLNSPYF